MKLTVITYFLFMLLMMMSPVVSLSEREHGSNPGDGKALASKQSSMVRGETRHQDEVMESQLTRAEQDYRGTHSAGMKGGGKKGGKGRGCGSKSKASKSTMNPPIVCKDCWCDPVVNECPRFNLVAQFM
jgi:hypothetical protein